ncbi:hypothetical protein [Streptomyces sp. NPDC053431]|uniref:hypothetical protein n=1 Tax=Streptomyces sp. NPDC053431 TaxID=3365703 RepID=UPI0037D92BA2
MDPAIQKALEEQEAVARKMGELLSGLGSDASWTGGGPGGGWQMRPETQEALMQAMAEKAAAGQRLSEELMRRAREGK